MKQAQHLIASCPPYVLFLGGLASAVAVAVWQLLGVIRGLGLAA